MGQCMGGPLRVRQRVIGVHAVMAARESGDRVHVGVEKLLCPNAGGRLAADIGDLFAVVKI